MVVMSTVASNYWLDQIADKAMAAHPKGEIIVESGHAPSGYYHIGTLREILTASAIAWRINQAGGKARHIDFVDDFDALRKVPAGVPAEWSKYIGWPLYLVPDPTGKHESWAQWLTSELYGALAHLGIDADVQYAHNIYPTGVFTPYIEQTLASMDRGRKIITSLSKRSLPDDWSPVQILSDGNSLREWQFDGWDKKRQVVKWRDLEGQTGDVSYTSGRVKLDWRFDWPARWALLGVYVEPFGRDHASSGGSYDTGAAIIRDIFGKEPPMPVPYDFINRAGHTKKMSKSAGDVVTISGALEIMPPEIVRFFILKSMPARQLFFDEGMGLVNLIDEFAHVQTEVRAGQHPEFEQAYEVASATTPEQTISDVPFGHLVQCFQAAEGEVERTLELLSRSGHDGVARDEPEVIRRELKFVANWLDQYAPDSVKFSVQSELPRVDMTDGQRVFLAQLAETIGAEPDLSGQGMHDAIYAAAQVADVKPGHGFEALYKVILGQNQGPKAGWFLASLDRGWLVDRLKEGSRLQAPVGRPDAGPLEATLPDGRVFRIEADVVGQFPGAAVGWIVADVVVMSDGRDFSTESLRALTERGVTRENLAEQAEITAWRGAYRLFGVKPSDYRSSVEALGKRVLDGKHVKVNSIVDVYNYVSVKYLLPAGAMDLDQVKGDILLRFGKSGETAELFGLDKPVKVEPEQVVYADEMRIISWLWNYRDAKETAVTEKTRRAVFFIDSLLGPERVTEAVTEVTSLLENVSSGRIIASGVLSSP